MCICCKYLQIVNVQAVQWRTASRASPKLVSTKVEKSKESKSLKAKRVKRVKRVKKYKSLKVKRLNSQQAKRVRVIGGNILNLGFTIYLGWVKKQNTKIK